MGVVARVSLVISGGASLDGGLSVALYTHLHGLREPGLCRPVRQDKDPRCLILPHPLEKRVDYTEWGKSIKGFTRYVKGECISGNCAWVKLKGYVSRELSI